MKAKPQKLVKDDKPTWTVLYNIANESGWVGTGWEFFNTEEEATAVYKRKGEEGHCACKRPFHNNDIVHLGAAHRR